MIRNLNGQQVREPCSIGLRTTNDRTALWLHACQSYYTPEKQKFRNLCIKNINSNINNCAKRMTLFYKMDSKNLHITIYSSGKIMIEGNPALFLRWIREDFACIRSLVNYPTPVEDHSQTHQSPNSTAPSTVLNSPAETTDVLDNTLEMPSYNLSDYETSTPNNSHTVLLKRAHKIKADKEKQFNDSINAIDTKLKEVTEQMLEVENDVELKVNKQQTQMNEHMYKMEKDIHYLITMNTELKNVVNEMKSNQQSLLIELKEMRKYIQEMNENDHCQHIQHIQPKVLISTEMQTETMHSADQDMNENKNKQGEIKTNLINETAYQNTVVETVFNQPAEDLNTLPTEFTSEINTANMFEVLNTNDTTENQNQGAPQKKETRSYKPITFPDNCDNLIISDSMGKRISGKKMTEDKNEVTCIRSYSGLKIQEMITLVQQTAETQSCDIVQNVILHVGTNNVNTGENNETVRKNVKKLLATVSHKFPNAHVHISSIIPRKGNETTQNTVKSMNNIIKSMCNTSDVMFIDNTPQFSTPNGNLKRQLFLRGEDIHLNYYGRIALVDKWKEALYGPQQDVENVHRRSTNLASRPTYAEITRKKRSNNPIPAEILHPKDNKNTQDYNAQLAHLLPIMLKSLLQPRD